MGPNDFNQGRRRRPPAQGQGGARPLPNDEYGDGHRQVHGRYSRQLNNNIASQNGTDGNYSGLNYLCLLYTSPSPRDQRGSRMPSSA